MTRRNAQNIWRAPCAFGAFCALALLFGCSSTADDEKRLQARGRELFHSESLSPSGLNLFTCSTCHEERRANEEIVKAGAVMAGVTLRPSFWGGSENDLLSSINACRAEFMAANTPLDATNPDADALYAFLVSLEPGSAAAVPFSVVREISDIARGDATRGASAYSKACSHCHGSMHEGSGRLDERVPILPEDTLQAHATPSYSPRTQRLVFIEKTRHGGLLNYGGQMPPFSSEKLPDADLSDLLEAMGVLGQ